MLVVVQFYECAATGPTGMRKIAVDVQMNPLPPPEVGRAAQCVRMQIHAMESVSSEEDEDDDDDEEQAELLRNGIPIDTLSSDEEADMDEGDARAT